MARKRKNNGRGGRHGKQKSQQQVADDRSTFNEHVNPSPMLRSPANAFEDYMARSDRSPQMRDRWRAEEEPRSRPLRRDRDRSLLRHRSPTPRRADPRYSHRSRESVDTDSYRPVHKRDPSRDSRKYAHRKPSPSPHRPPNPRHSHQPRSRPLEDRITHPCSPSLERAVKRRRTRSPSPARSDRWIPEHRRSSRSRERHDPSDRRPVIDRAFSPRRSSPVRSLRPEPREPPTEVDSYVPNPRRRDPTPPASRRRERRSRSPQWRPQKQAPAKERDLSPYSARVLKTKQLEAERPAFSAKVSTIPSNPPSIIDEGDRESMDGQYQMRGHGHRGGWNQNRPQRTFVDTRQQQYGGSPPFATPNSTYHGSPHSASPYHNRGAWNGPQGHHGPTNNASPPYRQNSFPAVIYHNPNPYHQNQQQYNGPTYQQQSFRGGHNNYRGGGQYQHRGNYDRRFSGPGPHNHQNHHNSHRGRGGFNNNQWSGPARGGSQIRNTQGSYPNSLQTSPAPSHPPSHDEHEASGDENISTLAKDTQEDKTPSAPSAVQDNQGNTQPNTGSKISFQFKPKQPQTTPAKPSADLISKAKPPAQSTDNRNPPTHPKNRSFHDYQNKSSKDQRHDGYQQRQDGKLPVNDKKPPNPNDRKHPYERPQNDGRRPGRSRSPPTKKVKKEPQQRPRILPELAKSESIYFRKPGNESVVGAGTYGKVFKAIHIFTRDKVALKKIRMEGERDGFPITAIREIRLLQHLRHKHVVALQEVMVEKNEAYMVFEYLSHDLTGLINHPTFRLTPAHKKDLARQMFDGLDFLHRRGVLHRDIKAANILISSNGQLKYADFGLARFYTKSRQLDYTNRVITIWYRPPELILGETQYGPAVDVWSAACVFMEMFTRKAVFPGEGGELSQLEKVYNILGTPTRSEWPKIIDLPWFELMQPRERKQRQFEMMFAGILSTEAMAMVKWCFKYDPAKRPTAEDVLQHPYFISEEPEPVQAVELEEVKGDWHEFESKAHRRGEEKRKKQEWEREREKRKRAEKEAKEGKTERKDETMSTIPSEPQSVPPPEPEVADESDGEGSARMSMSPP